jgi:hypothetical protein
MIRGALSRTNSTSFDTERTFFCGNAMAVMTVFSKRLSKTVLCCRVLSGECEPGRSVGVYGREVFALQVGKLCQDLVFRHAAGQIFQNVLNREAQIADTGLP